MSKEKVGRGWRTTAIIFMVISAILAAFILAVYSYGNSLAEDRGSCMNYCAYKNYESYDTDSDKRICYCYVGEEIKENSNLDTIKRYYK